MKHLLSVDDLSRGDVEDVLDLAASFLAVTKRDIPKVPALRGKTIVSLFFEDSTRTRLSFETAAKRMSADVMTFSVATSSVKKGEGLRDTVGTISAMGIDAVVIRHSSAGAPQRVTEWIDASIINAGDGRHEHPTQALLDVFTITQHRGRDLAGLKVGIIGDVRNSRVARSDAKLLTALGAHVTLVAPPTLLPESVESWGATASLDLDSVLPELDVVMTLRVQHERDAQSRFPSLREFTKRYGLTLERAARMRPDALVMHPGPMNRGVEIAGAVADGASSVIDEQVTNGVAVRMAVLWKILGSGDDVV
ncbi:MAG: aspartate carbamoyltransferase catalytic subunit [Actinomycetes bacterium]